MYEDIKRNKMKSNIIVFGFILMVTLIIYFICMAFNLGTFSIVFALIFSIISAYSTYYNSDKIILSVTKARPATHEEDQKLVNILDTLMLSSGLEHKPKLYVTDDSQPNAFATGRNPENSIICVTTGLLEKLNYYELEGVIAHELSHIKNYDIRLSAVVTVMLGLIVMLSDIFSRWTFRSSKKDNDNKGNSILMIVGLICLIFAPIFGKLMQLAISRKREFLADATAIEFTRNPDGLISALAKLDADTDELKVASSSTAHLFIVTPLKSKKKTSSLFSTHPSIEDRIEALKNLK